MTTTRIESKQELKEIKPNLSILSIQNAKKTIEPFKTLDKIAGQVQFVEGALNNLETMTEEEIEDFSKILNTWVGDNSLAMVKIASRKDSFADVLYQVSLALAAAKPRNSEDFATMEKIDSANRVVTSDRYQFDINSIVHWINTKGSFENPYTKCQFSTRDQTTIKNIAAAKNMQIVRKKMQVDDNPALLAGALSALEQEEKLNVENSLDDLFSHMPMFLFGPQMSMPNSGRITFFSNGSGVVVTQQFSISENGVRSTFNPRR